VKKRQKTVSNFVEKRASDFFHQVTNSFFRVALAFSRILIDMSATTCSLHKARGFKIKS
jgi:hypothetical protein